MPFPSFHIVGSLASNLPSIIIIVVVVVVVVVAVAEQNDIRHSKSGSKPSVFDTFDLDMRFAPQRGALFRPLHDIRRSKSGPSMR